MKLLLFSDVHLGVRRNSLLYMEIIEKFFKNIHDVIQNEKIDHIWILGDLFEDQHFINSYILNKAFAIFDDLLNNFKNLHINIITGNHDMYFKNDLSITSLKMFMNYHKNLKIINKIEEVDYNGYKVIAYPWLFKNSEESKQFKENTKSYDLCLGHFDITGFELIKGVEYSGGMVVDDFKYYDMVFSGHFHIKQTRGKINYCGCPYELNWGDCNDEKVVYVIDTNTKNVKFIKNDYSPKHIKVKCSQVDYSNITNNFIKLFS
jgi:DNA repair exonuclease SbcCD nuclease subunit